MVRLRLSSAGEQLLAESQPALAWQNATRNISPNRIRNATSALREALVTLQEDNEGTVFGACHELHLTARSSRSASTAAARWATGCPAPETRKLCRIYVAKTDEAA